MKPIVQILVLALITYGCAKQEQRQETSFTCSVEDITTGTMTEKAGVFLYENHTPSAPFTSLSRNVVEYFEVDYGSSFSYEFNAKRGNGYEYVLEFDDFAGGFNVGSINPETYSPFYYVNSSCELLKKESNNCNLTIEPSAIVRFDAQNELDGSAQESDSIYWILSDGNAFFEFWCKGIGGCPESRGTFPHGQYNFHYQIYRNGQLDEEESYPLYIRHRLDTTIFINF